MVTMLRVDDRLLHGQVAFVWTKHLGVDAIVVANDAVMQDKIQMMSLKMAAPNGIKLAIKSVADAINLLNNPKANTMKILTLVKNPLDALEIVKKVSDIALVNIGNYGRMNQGEDNKKALTPEVYVSEKDLSCLREIAATGLKFVIQMVPSVSEKSVRDLLLGGRSL